MNAQLTDEGERGAAPASSEYPAVVGPESHAAPVDPRYIDDLTLQRSGSGVIEQSEQRRNSPVGGSDPLSLVDAADLEGQEVPARTWMLEGWEPEEACTYLTGPGATGKSLLAQQRLTCSASALPFLGVATRPAISIYITCEDDINELHRRQDAINRVLGISWSSLRGRLFLSSLKPLENRELVTFDSDGRMRTTERWGDLLVAIDRVGASHVALDNVAHFFSGNENIRHQVAAFVGLLDALAQRIRGGVLLLGHPNKAGAEYSGSTAWENQVRARIYLSLDDPENGVSDPDARTLTNSKPNYARRGEALRFRWHHWAFVQDQDLAPGETAEMAAKALAARDDKVFLACLRIRNEQMRPVSAIPCPNFAPTQFAKMLEAFTLGSKMKHRRDRLAAAMERLFRTGAIETGLLWRDTSKGRDVKGLREVPRTTVPHRPQDATLSSPEQGAPSDPK